MSYRCGSGSNIADPNDKSIIVLLGIVGGHPSGIDLIDLQQSVEMRINNIFGVDERTPTVNLTTKDDPTRKQKYALGNIDHVQQYDVHTPWADISSRRIDAVESSVKDVVSRKGYSIEGSKTDVS